MCKSTCSICAESLSSTPIVPLEITVKYGSKKTIFEGTQHPTFESIIEEYDRNGNLTEDKNSYRFITSDGKTLSGKILPQNTEVILEKYTDTFELTVETTTGKKRVFDLPKTFTFRNLTDEITTWLNGATFELEDNNGCGYSDAIKVFAKKDKGPFKANVIT